MAEYAREARIAGVAAAEIAATLKHHAAAAEQSEGSHSAGTAAADLVFPAGTYYGRLHSTAVRVVDGIFVPAEATNRPPTLDSDVAASLAWLREHRGAWGERAAERLGPDNDFLIELELHDESRGGRVPGGKVDAEGAHHIARALCNNRVVRVLNLADNDLRADGASHLAWALSSNRSLTELNLAGNGVGDAGARSLAPMLRENTALSLLDLRDNDLSEEARQMLKAAWGRRDQGKLRLED